MIVTAPQPQATEEAPFFSEPPPFWKPSEIQPPEGISVPTAPELPAELLKPGAVKVGGVEVGRVAGGRRWRDWECWHVPACAAATDGCCLVCACLPALPRADAPFWVRSMSSDGRPEAPPQGAAAAVAAGDTSKFPVV